MVPASAGSRIPLLMVTTMSTPSDKVFERLLQHRDSILRQHRWLAGDEVSPTLAADAWQINAGNLALELRKYASLLDAISAGLLTGPVVFPSWDEGEADKGCDDDASIFMDAVRHDIRLAGKDREVTAEDVARLKKWAEGGAE